MDRFDTALRETMSLPEAEIARAVEARRTRCICGTCPTGSGIAKSSGEKFYCGTGHSFSSIPQDRGCICPMCPVTTDIGNRYKSYCLFGSEKAQRYENFIWGVKRK